MTLYKNIGFGTNEQNPSEKRVNNARKLRQRNFCISKNNRKKMGLENSFLPCQERRNGGMMKEGL
jgi:hypothetical protein